MIPITQEQISERDRWEKMLIEGRVNLFDGLYMMLKTGAPATEYLIDRLAQAEVAYQDGDFSDFAIAFGCQLSKTEKRSMKRETLRNHVKTLVDHFSKNEGFKLLNPNQHPDTETAFHMAAKHLDKKTEDGLDVQPLMSASTVFDIFYDRDSAGRKAKN